ncbi:hypothetical protein [Algoriphagus confluentis]|uniref:Uncharacterized protein n=1 Tax=Algoriphagus confluentis TaxID=1697556 RepID=A0ABQ6PJ48_9BACT|nr:hypothetical protein Aconfl_02730 [Algoriphagus confluentis]
MKLSPIILPSRFKPIGWILLGPFAFLTYKAVFQKFSFEWLDMVTQSLSSAFNFEVKNLVMELAFFGLLISLFLISFSREKEEDDFIQKIRLDGLLVASYGYFLINVLGTLIFFGLDYLPFIFFNLIIIPVLFLVRFHWVLLKERIKPDLAL